MNYKRFLTVLLVGCFLSGCTSDQVEVQELLPKYEETYETEGEEGSIDIVASHEVNGTTQYLIKNHENLLLFGDDVYVTYEAKSHIEGFAYELPDRITTLLLKIYIRDFKTGEIVKERDIKDIMDSKYANYQIDSYEQPKTAFYEGRRCVVFYVEKKPTNLLKNTPVVKHMLYISIDDDYHKIDKETVITTSKENIWEFDRNVKSACTDFLEKNGIYGSLHMLNPNFETSAGTGFTYLAKSYSTTSSVNSAMSELFSEVKDLDEDDRGNYYYLFYGLSEEEITKLLIGTSEEITLDGLILQAQCSIDGEEHIIESDSDYENYLRK